MKVLFATKNPAKIKFYKTELEKYGFEVLTISDLNVDIEVEETGKTGEQNAMIKATAYQKLSKIITIAVDDNLYFEGLGEEEQPRNKCKKSKWKKIR